MNFFSEADEIPRALIVPGIQDTNEDWRSLEKILHDRLKFVFSNPPTYGGESYESWKRIRLEKHLKDAEENNCRIVMGHSWGTHLELELLLSSDNFKAGILLNVPSNKARSLHQQQERSKRPNPEAERLMCEQALDMEDDMFFDFAERHGKNYETNTERILTEFRILRKSTREELERKLSNPHLPPTLMIQAPNDVWHIGDLMVPSSVAVRTLENTYHYPHVSKTMKVSEAIHEFLDEQGFDESSWGVAQNQMTRLTNFPST